jgi:hypothetical protein
VDLLIHLVHRINTRAEQRVKGETVAELRRVVLKEGILFKLAEAARAPRQFWEVPISVTPTGPTPGSEPGKSSSSNRVGRSRTPIAASATSWLATAKPPGSPNPSARPAAALPVNLVEDLGPRRCSHPAVPRTRPPPVSGGVLPPRPGGRSTAIPGRDRARRCTRYACSRIVS